MHFQEKKDNSLSNGDRAATRIGRGLPTSLHIEYVILIFNLIVVDLNFMKEMDI